MRRPPDCEWRFIHLCRGQKRRLVAARAPPTRRAWPFEGKPDDILQSHRILDVVYINNFLYAAIAG
jgi:hypothetical protein